MKSVTVSRSPIDKLTGESDQCFVKNLRIQGDSLVQEGKLFEALEFYNKSLCAAQLNSHDISSCYERRSAVYFIVEEYTLCLVNIELARKNGCMSLDQLEILKNREEKCKKLMEYHQRNVDSNNPWSFFKLSYETNEKIPFIIDCIDLHNNKKYGRFVITTQDLKPGDIIAIEEPFFKTVNYETSNTRCMNCLKSNKLSLIPNAACKTAMFCSYQCIEVATKTFFHAQNESKMHDIKQRMLFEALAICDGSYDKLQQLMDATDITKKTIFDFDLSNPNDPLYKYNLLTSIMSLSQVATVSNGIVNYLSHHPVLDSIKNQDDKEIAKRFLLRCFRILTVNSFGLEWVVPARPRDSCKDTIITKQAGDGLCLFGSLLNHSCIPNVDRVLVDNKFVFFVRRPIREGQQLFISYGPLFLDVPREVRQENLKDDYGFVCTCEACTRDYPTSAVYPWTGIPIVINELSNVDEWKQEFKKNCLRIVKYENILSHSELCLIMLRNVYYLVAISKTEPFIF